MERRDLLLVVLAAAKGASLTPVQLQKSLFLLSESTLPEKPRPFYEFEPYHYGPFAIEIYDDVSGLVESGSAVAIPAATARWNTFAATPAGQAEAARLRPQLSDKSLALVESTVAFVRSLSFSQLVKVIYAHFPHYRENSVFQE